MKRSQFLATIAALFAAPFISKSKPEETNITEKYLIDLVDSISPAHRQGKFMLYADGHLITELTPVDLEYVPYKEFDPNTIPRWYVDRPHQITIQQDTGEGFKDKWTF